MGVRELAAGIKNAVDKRIANEARAKRGVIKNGRFVSGATSRPFIAAVDANLNAKVWAQISPNGNAIIIGD